MLSPRYIQNPIARVAVIGSCLLVVLGAGGMAGWAAGAAAKSIAIGFLAGAPVTAGGGIMLWCCSKDRTAVSGATTSSSPAQPSATAQAMTVVDFKLDSAAASQPGSAAVSPHGGTRTVVDDVRVNLHVKTRSDAHAIIMASVEAAGFPQTPPAAGVAAHSHFESLQVQTNFASANAPHHISRKSAP